MTHTRASIVQTKSLRKCTWKGDTQIAIRAAKYNITPADLMMIKNRKMCIIHKYHLIICNRYANLQKKK